MKKNFIIITGLLLLGIAACDPNRMYEENQRIAQNTWHFSDTLAFAVQVSDTTLLHDIFLNVRNNTDYPYSNFILFLDMEMPDGRILRDTIECILADRTGRWTGSGFGKIKSNSFHFRKDVWFPIQGIYQFRFQQAMREENLPGITDIGLRIERK